MKKYKSITFKEEDLKWSWIGADYFGYIVVKHLAKLIRANGINMAVIRGDGTTYPRQLWGKKITNYIKVERHGYGGGRGHRFRKCTPEDPVNVYMYYWKPDGIQIKKILDKLHIPYYWNGSVDKAFRFTINKKENGFILPFRK